MPEPVKDAAYWAKDKAKQAAVDKRGYYTLEDQKSGKFGLYAPARKSVKKKSAAKKTTSKY
jgi:hypothetical protein